jgi:pilus biogenesis lipoprotein CpaD
MRLFSRSLLSLVAIFGLTGCAEWEQHAQSRLPDPMPAYHDKQIVVSPYRAVYLAEFSEGATQLHDREIRQLKAFLDEAIRYDKTAKVRLELISPKASKIEKIRAVSVARALNRLGYTSVSSLKLEQFPIADTVRVIVDHNEAYVPNCPNWEMHSYFSFGSQPLPNLACADRSNLAAMVADPNDLVTGQLPNAWGAAGNAALLGENRYRTGGAYAPADSTANSAPGTIGFGGP